MEFAGDCTGRAFINYAFDFIVVSPIYIYPRAPGRFENIG